jgi:hypothetical protein
MDFPSRYLNPEPSRYKAEVLIDQPRRSGKKNRGEYEIDDNKKETDDTIKKRRNMEKIKKHKDIDVTSSYYLQC